MFVSVLDLNLIESLLCIAVKVPRLFLFIIFYLFVLCCCIASTYRSYYEGFCDRPQQRLLFLSVMNLIGSDCSIHSQSGTIAKLFLSRLPYSVFSHFFSFSSKMCVSDPYRKGVEETVVMISGCFNDAPLFLLHFISYKNSFVRPSYSYTEENNRKKKRSCPTSAPIISDG